MRWPILIVSYYMLFRISHSRVEYIVYITQLNANVTGQRPQTAKFDRVIDVVLHVYSVRSRVEGNSRIWMREGRYISRVKDSDSCYLHSSRFGRRHVRPAPPIKSMFRFGGGITQIFYIFLYPDNLMVSSQDQDLWWKFHKDPSSSYREILSTDGQTYK